MTFYLGTHRPSWLGRVAIPWFVSRRCLVGMRTLPRARALWALDSGGFSELSMFHQWTTTPRQYVAEVRRFSQEIGQLAWAAQQDWMCEPFMLAKTGKSIVEHQRLTVANYATLLSMAPDLPWRPVLQGWLLGDYLRHVDMFTDAGYTLDYAGLGSVCRRQATSDIGSIVQKLYSMGLRLHGFGVKAAGLRRYGQWLESADSMAWSFNARRRAELLPGCVGHKNCANCIRYALQWREKVLVLA